MVKTRSGTSTKPIKIVNTRRNAISGDSSHLDKMESATWKYNQGLSELVEAVALVHTATTRIHKAAFDFNDARRECGDYIAPSIVEECSPQPVTNDICMSFSMAGQTINVWFHEGYAYINGECVRILEDRTDRITGTYTQDPPRMTTQLHMTPRHRPTPQIIVPWNDPDEINLADFEDEDGSYASGSSDSLGSMADFLTDSSEDNMSVISVDSFFTPGSPDLGPSRFRTAAEILREITDTEPVRLKKQ